MNLVKFVRYEISIPMAHIFSLSLETGTFPEKFKISRTVPIFKQGDPALCDNYRPISLINTFSKILEKMVAIKLKNHLEINKLLYKHQYGFQHGLSTEHNLLQVTNFIGQALNENKWCIGIFLDLKKAFDCLRHNILLRKLQKFGVTGTAHKWFSSYLSNRSQRVKINGMLSSQKNINISVLQGSVLGPLLFLCFINDIFMATPLAIFLFADDTSLLDKDDNLDELINRLNIELNKLANWFRANGMAVNTSKTKYVIFHTKGKKINLSGRGIFYDNNEIGKPHNPDLIVPLDRIHNNHPDPACKYYKLLGVLFDEYLNLSQHIQYVANKLSRSLFFLNRAKKLVTNKSLKMLYFATIHSHLLYCPIIMSCASQTSLKRIVILQKKAIRSISNANYNAHTSQLFVTHQILPFEKIIQEAKLKFMHSVRYDYCPISFQNIWKLNTDRQHNHELRNLDQFVLPYVRVESFKKNPAYSLPAIWNSTEIELTHQHNRVTFSIALRYRLFEQINN